MQLELGLGAATELGGNMLSQASNILEHVSRVVLAQLDSQGAGFPIRAFVLGPAALEGILNKAVKVENNIMITRLLAAHMRTFASDRQVEVLIRNGDILLESHIEPTFLINKCHSRVKLKRGGIKVMVSRNTALKANVGVKNFGQSDVRGTVFLSGDIDVTFKMDVQVDVSVGKELAYFCLPLVDKTFPVQIETQAKIWVGAKIGVDMLRVEDRPFDPNGISGGLGNLGNLFSLLTTPRPGYHPPPPGHVMMVPVAYAPSYQSYYPTVNGYTYPAQNIYTARGPAAHVARPVPFNNVNNNNNGGGLLAGVRGRYRQTRTRLRGMLGMNRKKRKRRRRKKREAVSETYGAPKPTYGAPKPSYGPNLEKHLVFRVGVDLAAEIRHFDVHKLKILKGCDVHIFKYKVYSYCEALSEKLVDFVTHFVTEISDDGLPIVLNGVEKFFNTTIGSEVAVPLLLADEKGAILSTVFQKMDQVRLLKKDLLKDLTALIKSTGKLVPGDPIELFADTAAVIGEAVHSGVASLKAQGGGLKPVG